MEAIVPIPVDGLTLLVPLCYVPTMREEHPTAMVTVTKSPQLQTVIIHTYEGQLMDKRALRYHLYVDVGDLYKYSRRRVKIPVHSTILKNCCA